MKKIILPLIAVILLAVSLASLIYENNKQSKNNTIEKEKIEINNKKYIFPNKFKNIDKISISNFNGIPLDKIIIKTGIKNLESLKFTIIAEDNYQKTVSWEDLKKGIITDEKKVIFEHLPKGFWIKNVIKIEAAK